MSVVVCGPGDLRSRLTHSSFATVIITIIIIIIPPKTKHIVLFPLMRDNLSDRKVYVHLNSDPTLKFGDKNKNVFELGFKRGSNY